MKQTTKIAVAGLLSAAGSVLHAFAAELGGSSPAETSEPSVFLPQDPALAQNPKRTRKAAAEKPAPPAETEPQPVAETTTTTTLEPEGQGEGETQEEKDARYAKNRALIEPLVKGVKVEGSETEYKIKPQGGAVKAIIKKYSPSEKLPDLPLDKQADFEGDLEALTM